MKTSRILLLSAVLPCFLACERDSQPANGQSHMVPVSVEASLVTTKTTIDGLTPLWEKGEQVAFFTTDLELCPAFSAEEGGVKTTVFSGQKPEGSSLAYALYPYSSSASFSKSGIVTSLPAKQDGTISNAVMVASGSESNGFSFLNVCSVVKVNIPASLNIVKVEIIRDDRVSGTFHVTPSGGTLSYGCSDPTSMSDRKVAAVSDDGFSGDVYIALLPSSSTTLNLALTDKDGQVAIVSKTFSSGKPYSSGSLKNLGTLSAPSFGDAAQISDPTYSQL